MTDPFFDSFFQDTTPLREWQGGEPQLPAIGRQLAEALGLSRQDESNSSAVCVWLHGEMGMGKTTLMGHLLRSLGLPDNYPVTSPTFSLVNEYPIGDRYFAHLDLYRISGSSMDESLLDHRAFAGVFIEWPTAVDDLDAAYPASHHLRITAIGSDQRRYQLYSAQ